MKFSLPTILAATFCVTSTSAFAPQRPMVQHRSVITTSQRSNDHAPRAKTVRLAATGIEQRDDEVTRLKAQAAQLRAQAAALEAEKQATVAEAASRAFDRFDRDRNGEVTVEELKAGLEKTFKMDLPDERVTQLMEAFDKSGDGVLQKDEMVQVEQFRNKLEALVRDEKEQARMESKRAISEQQAAEQLRMALELVNDQEPTAKDKVLSVLPYLFPLLDGLQFAGPWAVQHPDNPIAQAAGVAYALYRSIPLGGFLAFFALTTLSGNPTLNRLIRFNMQQAIYLDIALFAPAVVLSLINLTGAQIPPAVSEITSNALLATMLLTVAYASVTSLVTGQAPDKIPLISSAVERRLPAFDIMGTDGRVLTKEEREKARRELKALKRNQDENEDSENGDEAS